MPTWWRNEKGYVEEAGALHQLGRLALLQMGGWGGGQGVLRGRQARRWGARSGRSPQGQPSGMSGWQREAEVQAAVGWYRKDR